MQKRNARMRQIKQKFVHEKDPSKESNRAGDRAHEPRRLQADTNFLNFHYQLSAFGSHFLHRGLHDGRIASGDRYKASSFFIRGAFEDQVKILRMEMYLQRSMFDVGLMLNTLVT